MLHLKGGKIEDHKIGYLSTGCGCCFKMVVQACRKSEMCGLCRDNWIRGLYAKFHSRKRRQGRFIEVAILWTLGTSFDDTERERGLLRHQWNKFRMWMDNYSKWRPIFRVIEKGGKSGKLHVHFINVEFLDHEQVLTVWRGITGEKSNVNFSYCPGGRTEDILGYLLKYLTKDDFRYSWMGDFYRVGSGESRRYVCEHGHEWEFVPAWREGPGDASYYTR